MEGPHAFVIETDDGPKWTANNARPRLQERRRPRRQQVRSRQASPRRRQAETGLYADGAKDIRRVSDPHLRIKDLDRDGVDAEVIYGILGASSRLNDHDAANEMLRIYNDWLKDFCSHYPDRHIGLACLPTATSIAAVKEIYRVAKLGLRGLELSCSWDMEPIVAPDVGAAVEGGERRAASPAFPYLPDASAQHHRKARRRVGRSVFFTVVSGFQMNLVNILAAIIAPTCWSAIPTSASPFGESGSAGYPMPGPHWISNGRNRFHDLGLKMKPSDYWRRQCKATFQFDRIGAKLIDDMGAESLMWGSDYPHGAACGRTPTSTQGAVRRGLAGGDAHDHLHQRRQVLRADQLVFGPRASRPASSLFGARTLRGAPLL